MLEENYFEDQDYSDFLDNVQQKIDMRSVQKQYSFSSLLSKEGIVDPPKQLSKRSYSLEPDMINGWKPKKTVNNSLNNVFPLNCHSKVIDYLLKQLYRKKFEWQIAYLGPRYQNSYMLHQNKRYQNPYPQHKKLQLFISQRPNMPLNPHYQQKNLKFNSNFQCGNLDAAVYVSHNEYDLFMRVDTNTKGHNNWYFFTVQNFNFVGSVRFNICNFRREKSLYQRGLKPYCFSKKNSQIWKQVGQNVKYEKKSLRYKFLYDEEDLIPMLNKYITLSFTYHFDTPNDLVEVAYFIPYSYSRLLKVVSCFQSQKYKFTPKILPSFKSLSGISIPIIEVTDSETPQYNKTVIIVTGRIHPGQSTSSFVAEGFLQYICSQQINAIEFRKNFIAYVIPMVNPDGVVAGNYRTSLFGKDLNRTFNQNRKYAFPQTYHLLQFAKDLKAKHKKKFTIFLDLHGHSVKKNIFMYGPQFSIQHPNYYLAKQLPKILSSLTPLFRFYSCIFRISSEKSATARATLNKQLNIPFTYTMQSSNGFYYDSIHKKQFQLNSKKLKKMGMHLCQALNIFKKYEANRKNIQIRPSYAIQEHNQSNLIETQKQFQNYQQILQYKDKQQEKISDDEISQGNSDSQPSEEDLSDTELQKLLQTIQQGKQQLFTSEKVFSNPTIPQNNTFFKFTKLSQREIKAKGRYKKKNPLLPPINCLNRNKQRAQRTNKSLLQPKISRVGSPQKLRKIDRISITHIVQQGREFEKNIKKQAIKPSSFLRKKGSKMDFQKLKFFKDNI